MKKLTNHKPDKNHKEVKIFASDNLPKYIKESEVCGVFINNSSFATMDATVTHLVTIPKGKKKFWAGLMLKDSPTISELLDLWFKEQNTKEVKMEEKDKKKIAETLRILNDSIEKVFGVAKDNRKRIDALEIGSKDEK